MGSNASEARYPQLGFGVMINENWYKRLIDSKH